jgi:hypothetical protein
MNEHLLLAEHTFDTKTDALYQNATPAEVSFWEVLKSKNFHRAEVFFTGSPPFIPVFEFVTRTLRSARLSIEFLTSIREAYSPNASILEFSGFLGQLHITFAAAWTNFKRWARRSVELIAFPHMLDAVSMDPVAINVGLIQEGAACVGGWRR